MTNEPLDENYVKLGQLSRLVKYERRINYEEFKTIIGNNFDVNYQLPFNTILGQNNPEYIGNTVLHFFATFNDRSNYEESYLKLLLEFGANLFITNNKGYTPLLLAFYEGKDVALLLRAQFKSKNSTNSRCKNGISHFHVACSVHTFGFPEIAEIVNFFLKTGALVNERINDDSPKYPGYTPLHFAAENEKIEIIKLLLSNGADVNIKDAKGLTPLHLLLKQIKENNFGKDTEKCLMEVVCNNQYDLHSWLLHLECIFQGNNRSSEIGLSNEDAHINNFIEFISKVCPGCTPLHLAAHYNLKTVMSLLSHGANLLAKDAEGITPLDICLKKFPSISDIVEILKIEKRHELSKVKLTSGINLLDVLEAASNPNKIKEFLSQSNANVNDFIPFQSPIWPGFSLLHLGVLFNCCIPKLLAHRADMTMINMEGSSPLHLAFCMNKEFKTVNKILKAHEKVIINPVNKDNISHLHIACAAGDVKIIKLLLLNGADPNLSTLKDHRSTLRYFWYPDFNLKSGSTPLHFAINSKRKCKIINLLLDHNANPHLANADGVTPFHDVLENYLYFTNKKFLIPLINRMLDMNSEIWTTGATGNKKLVVVLLKLFRSKTDILALRLINEFDKKNISMYDELGITKLQIACYIGDLTMVKEELAKSVVNINQRTNFDCLIDYGLYICSGDTAMHILFREKPKQTNEIAELLFAHGADPTVKNLKNKTPIHVCDDEALQTAISLLEKKFTNINPIDNDGLSHFHLACKTTNVLVVKEFLESGIDINMTVDYFAVEYPGWTPLHFAICHGGEDVVELLLNYGANSKISNADGFPPIHQAVFEDSNIDGQNRLEKIIRHPAINFQDTSIFGDTILMIAIKNSENNKAIVKLLMDIGANVNHSWFTTENLNQSNFIFIMASRFSSDIFQRLIDLIPAVTTVDGFDRNALHCVASRCCYDNDDISDISDLINNIKILLNNGLELDQPDAEGFTALHIAAYYDDLEIGELLLSLGADINMKNDNGKTPIDIAFDNCDDDYTPCNLVSHVKILNQVGIYLEKSNETYLTCEDSEIPSNLKEQMQQLDFILKENIEPSYNVNYFFTEHFVINYRRMQPSRRQAILKFWNARDLHKSYPDLVPLINRQLRKARTRSRLLKPTEAAFGELIDPSRLPVLCVDLIINYLNNQDLMNLIRANYEQLLLAPLPNNC